MIVEGGIVERGIAELKIESTIKAWHQVLETTSEEKLDDLLADDVVFHSPVVHTPQVGKDLTKMYLMGAAAVLNNGSFKYEREILAGNNAVLEFTTVIDGITINGVDMITCDDDSKIIDFKVMLRPLKAVNTVHQKMGEMLASFNKS